MLPGNERKRIEERHQAVDLSLNAKGYYVHEIAYWLRLLTLVGGAFSGIRFSTRTPNPMGPQIILQNTS